MKVRTKTCSPSCEVELKDEANLNAEGSDEELARFASAIGHPARVQILRILKERGVCICGEIVEVLPLAQSTVSQHLKILKGAGLVQGEVEGARTCYCINPIALERFRILLGRI